MLSNQVLKGYTEILNDVGTWGKCIASNLTFTFMAIVIEVGPRHFFLKYGKRAHPT